MASNSMTPAPETAALVERLTALAETLVFTGSSASARDVFAAAALLSRPPQPEPQGTARALVESIKLQAHYAELLNMHDGGQRLIFKTVEEWLARLDGLIARSAMAQHGEGAKYERPEIRARWESDALSIVSAIRRDYLPSMDDNDGGQILVWILDLIERSSCGEKA